MNHVLTILFLERLSGALLLDAICFFHPIQVKQG